MNRRDALIGTFAAAAVATLPASLSAAPAPGLGIPEDARETAFAQPILYPISSSMPDRTIISKATHFGVGHTVAEGFSFQYSYFRGVNDEGGEWIEYLYEVPDVRGSIYTSSTSFYPGHIPDDGFEGFHRWSIRTSPDYTEWREGHTGRRWGEWLSAVEVAAEPLQQTGA